MYDVNTTDQIPTLDDAALDLTVEQRAVIRAALDGVLDDSGSSRTLDDLAIRAAHAYDRKGYITTDPFTGKRNTSYGRADDDIIVQVSFVIRADNRERHEALTALRAEIQATAAAAEIAAAEAKVAAAQADLAAAQSKLEQAQSSRAR